MDLYTMNENFIPDKPVDEFSSVIWTERYSSAGEVQLVVPAFSDYIQMLQEGKYLGLVGSREVMELKTQSVEDGKLTVLGKTLVGYLDERIHWARTSDPAQPIGDYTVDAAKLGELLADRVDQMVIEPIPLPGGAPGGDLNLDWANDKIAFLELGAIDHSGDLARWTVPVGPLYSVIQQLAEQNGVGISLYLESADADIGYVLKFTTYRGADHTSAQEVNDLIRLTPDLDTLTGLKEVRSIDGYKNVVYVNYQNKISIHYEDPDNIPQGMARRVLLTDAAGEPVGHKVSGTGQLIPGGGWYGGSYQYTVVDTGDIAAFREQNAKDALANHNYIRALDGQVSQTNQYKFGTDYGLGDLLELEGLTGIINTARVTEYIRAQDQTGIREYPTLSVVTAPTGA